MRRQTSRVLVVAAAGVTLAAPVAPAAARTTGKETFLANIVTSGTSGTRTVVSTLAVAGGVFDGVGKVVEIENRPGDPDNVSRDDLVFKAGTMHIMTTNGAVDVNVNPMSCAFTARIKQTTKVTGGTKRFRGASGKFAGTVRAWGVAARAADGTCSQDLPPLVEADAIESRGTLTLRP